MKFQIKPIQTEGELQQILTLQAQNLGRNKTPAEIAEQGFLTVQHDTNTLRRMNALEQGILAMSESTLAGYILAMSSAMREAVPILRPMFHVFDAMSYQHQPLSTYRYIVVGQVCVAEAYRGQGLFDAMYNGYRALLSPKYDFAVTEIATRNQRSNRAHQRVGFECLHTYHAPDGEEWNIVLWDWRP